MTNKTPEFWWKKNRITSRLLFPASAGYGFFASRNMKYRVPPKIDLPVLCVGNFTLGGSGKTPVTIAFAQVARKMGIKPGIVSRGFGGSVRDIHMVDVLHDCARDVGDEPLLLAKHARVVVSADRYAAARMLKEAGCHMILMDDGFQSRRLYPDYALLVVDAMRGFGNMGIFPAGPLRAPLKIQMAFADSILVIGDGAGRDAVVRFAGSAARPVHYARFHPSANRKVEGQRFLAFAGIGNPQKFFKSIEELGGIVEQQRIYADHYFFCEEDIRDIADDARSGDLAVATTAKDYVRLETGGLGARLDNLSVFDVSVVFETSGFCETILEDVMVRYKERRSIKDISVCVAG